ncbi:MAG: kynureninase [Phycisphaerales bacterium JB037]
MSENPGPDQWSLDWARAQDAADPLAWFRGRFRIPPASCVTDNPRDDHPAIYFTGNSLGCMPTGVEAALHRHLEDWADLGVEGHLKGRDPWYPFHEQLRGPLAELVGATPTEVVAMNSLTVNLHLMMVSFYRPTTERFRIVIENDAFGSDSYAVQSQARVHGLDPADAIVRLTPRAGEATLRTEDIEDFLRREGSSVALVLLGGVNYYTGQFFDIERITRAGHDAGAMVGWDLAHAAGNVPLRLHDWNADFACWCSYKYLNSGPGSIAACFVHERHAMNTDLPRFAGWWGNDPATRFEMSPDFVPVKSADAWALSNPPIFAAAPLLASLRIFHEAGMKRLRAKSERLTAFLEALVRRDAGTTGIEILTPSDPARRGCQLSLRLGDRARAVHAQLARVGVVCDYRAPDVLRVAPVPLYNTFQEVFRFAEFLRDAASGRTPSTGAHA